MAQGLRAITLAEEPGLFPSTHMVHIYNYFQGIQSPQTPSIHIAHIHICRQNTYKKKNPHTEKLLSLGMKKEKFKI